MARGHPVAGLRRNCHHPAARRGPARAARDRLVDDRPTGCSAELSRCRRRAGLLELRDFGRRRALDLLPQLPGADPARVAARGLQLRLGRHRRARRCRSSAPRRRDPVGPSSPEHRDRSCLQASRRQEAEGIRPCLLGHRPRALRHDALRRSRSSFRTARVIPFPRRRTSTPTSVRPAHRRSAAPTTRRTSSTRRPSPTGTRGS